jgi:hypothetical protein
LSIILNGFSIIEDVITARKFIKIDVVDEKATFVTFYTKKELVKINILLAVMYFLSLGILYINDLLVLLLKWLPYVNPISVNSSIYFLGLFFPCHFLLWL